MLRHNAFKTSLNQEVSVILKSKRALTLEQNTDEKKMFGCVF